MSTDKGEEDRMWSCCAVKQIAVQHTHQQCLVVDVLQKGGVWQHQRLAPQRMGELVAHRKEGEEEQKDSFLVTFYIRYTEDSAQTAEWQ